VKAGWLEVYGKEAAGDDDAPSLVPVQQGEQVKTSDVEVKGSQTKPPPRYTEATLLSAMEGAGKLVEDDELREAMSERGLGTPATRAAIIEGLIYEQYIHRNQRELVPSAKAFTLIALLNGLSIQELTRPELTGDWEFKLRQIQRGQLERERFMAEIRALTERIVAQTKAYEHDTIPGDFGKLKAPCPKCGGEVHENYKKFQCQKCDWNMWKVILGRAFELEEVETLLREKQVGPLQGFRSKQGFPFAAVMKLSPEGEAKFDFGDDQKDDENAAPVDFTGQEPLGKCPKCKGNVFEGPESYLCERSQLETKKCTFKTGKVVLQQPVDRAQVKKLLATGKTDPLDKFISKAGKPFTAQLKLADKGKVEFDFPER
jgi:DNA topoisomerase-3